VGRRSIFVHPCYGAFIEDLLVNESFVLFSVAFIPSFYKT
jgi:hypothetical protein